MLHLLSVVHALHHFFFVSFWLCLPFLLLFIGGPRSIPLLFLTNNGWLTATTPSLNAVIAQPAMTPQPPLEYLSTDCCFNHPLSFLVCCFLPIYFLSFSDFTQEFLHNLLTCFSLQLFYCISFFLLSSLLLFLFPSYTRAKNMPCFKPMVKMPHSL
ncbi:hypothetical protein I7I50_08550 [Histoplasma capsulatum G186AR]|uniref:Uncharacterized protein n=1 Tax=Ajellomyces capsulatus TaxID=5037 RepID=A0A8H8CZB3_AJECA|nr:hypothetical protein I7I52_06065 [Histoplasma capsulatum]QSS73681.1 hypothetical protein I7I50_08550 [Histoplasma capsulatum G186AR]